MIQEKKTYKHIFYAVEDIGNEYWGSWIPKNTLKEAKELYRKEIELAKDHPEHGPFHIAMYRIDEISGKMTVLKKKGVK